MKRIISEEIIPITQKSYFKMRKEEELEFMICEKNDNLKKRIKDFKKLKNLDIENISVKRIPDNEAQVVLLLTSLLCSENTRKYIGYIKSIAHYSCQSTTDLICLNNEDVPTLVEVEYLLSSLFKHEHPYETFDCIVCWSIDIDVNESRRLIDGTELKLINEKDNWLLKFGSEKVIPVIELSTVVKKIKKVDLIKNII